MKTWKKKNLAKQWNEGNDGAILETREHVYYAQCYQSRNYPTLKKPHMNLGDGLFIGDLNDMHGSLWPWSMWDAKGWVRG